MSPLYHHWAGLMGSVPTLVSARMHALQLSPALPLALTLNPTAQSPALCRRGEKIPRPAVALWYTQHSADDLMRHTSSANRSRLNSSC